MHPARFRITTCHLQFFVIKKLINLSCLLTLANLQGAISAKCDLITNFVTSLFERLNDHAGKTRSVTSTTVVFSFQIVWYRSVYLGSQRLIPVLDFSTIKSDGYSNAHCHNG